MRCSLAGLSMTDSAGDLRFDVGWGRQADRDSIASLIFDAISKLRIQAMFH